LPAAVRSTGAAFSARLLLGRTRDVTRRRWGWWVNRVAASPLLGERTRMRLLRWAGIAVEPIRMGPGCYFHTSQISIGPEAFINHGCHFENVAPIEIGPKAALGMFVVVATSEHEIAGPDRRAGGWRPKPVRIGAGAWLGTRVTVLGGVTIGDGCVVAAGAVVTEDLAPNGLYAGVPARRIRDLPE
jgi:maltose O-acetyltransferase